MLVSNHLSWLDIPVLHAARYCRFVSKWRCRAGPDWYAGDRRRHTLY